MASDHVRQLLGKVQLYEKIQVRLGPVMLCDRGQVPEPL